MHAIGLSSLTASMGPGALRFWMRMMWICLILGVLAAYAFIGTLDLEEGLNAAQRCNEMVELYQQTDGVYGWPNCDHL